MFLGGCRFFVSAVPLYLEGRDVGEAHLLDNEGVRFLASVVSVWASLFTNKASVFRTPVSNERGTPVVARVCFQPLSGAADFEGDFDRRSGRDFSE